jgi:hypothetical protein
LGAASRVATQSKSPLIIDANAVLAFTVTMEQFQPIAVEHSKVSQTDRSIQPIKPDSACLAKPENSLMRSPLAKRSVCLFR